MDCQLWVHGYVHGAHSLTPTLESVLQTSLYITLVSASLLFVHVNIQDVLHHNGRMKHCEYSWTFHIVGKIMKSMTKIFLQVCYQNIQLNFVEIEKLQE
jgi:hypothetical protein